MLAAIVFEALERLVARVQSVLSSLKSNIAWVLSMVEAHPVRELNNGDNKHPEMVENGAVKEEEEGSDEGLKRPHPDGVNLQWGQKKQARINKPDAKATVEESAGIKNSMILRPDRRVVRAEKVAPSQGRAPAAASSSQSLHKSTNGSRREIRETEGNGTAAAARDVDANNVHDSIANAIRKTDLSVRLNSLQLNRVEPVNPEKPSGNANTGALPTTRARPDANCHAEKSAPTSGKVDMEHFQLPKFNISLPRKEIEDDYFAITGCKLPSRPKKRPKQVEKTVTFISPGSSISGLTRESYEVKEKKCKKKKPRSLKAMESADSDSE